MNITTEILIAAAIVASMVLQVGQHRAGPRRLLAPLAIVAVFAFIYLKTIPNSGADGLFTLAGLGLGLVLGGLASLLMGVHRDAEGHAILSAGIPYVALWIGVFGARLAFVLIATNSPSTLQGLFVWAFEHGITQAGWVAFFMLQALAMVGVRTVIVGARVLLSGRSDRIVASAA